MSCILIRWKFGDDSGVIALFVFSVLAKPRIRRDWNLAYELLLPSGTYVQSFRSIDPAATKRAVSTDDDDGEHVIV
jgi:hypothetical protein